ncbi:MAG TPA: CsgG/HfaB family protein [Planctomycetota bacterium]|nr:CsgG/HfaB family protein [Planctomycetota bacterium]
MHCVFHKKIVVKWLFTFYFMLFTFLGGCAATGTNTTYGDDDSKCGIYPPPPANFIRKRIAIIPLKDKTNQQYTKTDLGSQAVDIGITLLLNAERFDVVERERLDALLAEQKLVGIVDPATAAKAGKILGVDLIFTGAITNFEIERSKTGGSFGLPRIGKLPAFDIEKKTTIMTISLAIDGRVIEVETGRVLFAGSGEIKREERADNWGVWLENGAHVSSKEKIRIDQNAAGKQLRFALDALIKKIIPKIDAAYGVITPAPVKETENNP